MNPAKSLFAAAFGAAALFAASQAADIAPCPDDYGLQAAGFVETRMEDARGSRVQVVSEPYRVAAEISGLNGVEGWGVDVKVRSRLPDGRYGGYVPYTVIFVDGAPVALCADASELQRV